MNNADKEYLRLCEDILKNGVNKDDRTGTGTLSVFGRQLRFDLSEGFPLLTTKRVPFRIIAEELLWFISGSTNVRDLQEKNVKIWDGDYQRHVERGNPDNGDMGPLYGKQLRNIEHSYWVEPRIYEPPAVAHDDSLPYGVPVELGNYIKDEHTPKLKEIWRDMLKRCYKPSSVGYAGYGAKGVHVAEEWHTFANFDKDVRKLTNWNCFVEYGSEYSLDKDVRFASNRYSADTCTWSSHAEQSFNTSTNRPFTAVSPEGEKILFRSTGDANRKHGMNVSAVHRCLNGKLHTHHGWSNFEYVVEEGKVLRTRVIDQLKEVIAEIKHNPDSRRLIISLYNPHELDKMALPPCHGNMIQFYVTGGKLSLSMYQRSADIFLGEPFNIASYALLLEMVAAITDLDAGELIISIGDAHLYSNHIAQVEEQMRREPKKLPKLHVIIPQSNDIDDFTYDHFYLSGYEPHPTIKGAQSF